MDTLQQIATSLVALPVLELIAVVLAVGYLVLAIRENIWCWACALVSTAIYVYLYWEVALISESILNAYYLIMAVYGWHVWRSGGPERQLPITRWPLRKHLTLIVITSAAVPLLGWYTATRFGADYPYLDAFTTCFAVVTTYLVARKVLENWLYWIVIDILAVYLNFVKGLELTAALFALYVVLAVVGYLRWRREWRQGAKPQPAVL